MQTISNLWWLWLLGMCLFGGYALFNQIARIASIGSVDGLEVTKKHFSTLSTGALLASSLLTVVSFVLLIIALIVTLGSM